MHDAWPINLTFSLTIVFYLTKTENRTQNRTKHSSHTIALCKDTIFAKNTDFLQKNADISKIKGVLVINGIFSKTT